MPLNISGSIVNSAIASTLNYKSIVTRGLLLQMEPGSPESYPQSGTTWTSLVGSYTATLVNGPTFDSTYGTIILDGVNDYMYIAHGGTLALSSGDFTISVWSKKISGTGYAGIITNDAAGDTSWKIFKDSGNAYYVARSYNVTINFPAYTIGTYHFYSYTLSGGTLSLYFDGVVGSTATGVGNPISNNNIAFGSYRYNDAVSGNNMDNAAIGTTLIHNRALSAAEILQNYNAQKSRYGR
jgi:hypothetical protein